jgi:probable O-glycosylation ligase (exosortase A-associated)
MSIRLLIYLVICLFFVVKSFRNTPVVLAALIIGMYFIYPEKYIWGLTEYRIVMVLNVILLVVILHKGLKLQIFGDIFSKLMVCLLSSFVLSAFFAKGDIALSREYAVMFLKIGLFWFMLKACLNGERDLGIFYWTCLLSITFLAAWGVEQYLLGNVRLEGFGGGQILGSNQIAAAMVWALPIAYFKFIQKQGAPRWIALACFCLLIAGLVCTQSRQAVVAVFVCLPWYFIYVKRKLIFLGGALIFILAGSFMVPSEFFQRIKTMEEYEEDASAMGRIEQWRGATKMFLDNPIIGVGGKNYYVLAHKYVEHPRVTHNTFFQILSEEGIIGITTFLLLFFITLKKLSALTKWEGQYEKPQYIPHYAMIAKISIMGLLVVCMFQNKAEHEFLYWPIAVAAALTAQARRWETESPEISPQQLRFPDMLT